MSSAATPDGLAVATAGGDGNRHDRDVQHEQRRDGPRRPGEPAS